MDALSIQRKTEEVVNHRYQSSSEEQPDRLKGYFSIDSPLDLANLRDRTPNFTAVAACHIL